MGWTTKCDISSQADSYTLSKEVKVIKNERINEKKYSERGKMEWD